MKVANWPKDPDERQRKAIIAAKKKNAPPAARVQVDAARSLPPRVGSPDQHRSSARRPADPGTTRPAYANDNNGTARIDPVYDQPGDLFMGGASALVPSSVSDTFNVNSWFGGKKTETAAARSEPTREALTQPPSGYQTPSPNYPYGPGAEGIAERTIQPRSQPARRKVQRYQRRALAPSVLPAS